MSRVVVGQLEAVGEVEVGEAVLMERAGLSVAKDPATLGITRVLEMDAMRGIADRDG
jgi:hypothetical protein